MPVYIKFKNNKQVETTTLESKPTGNNWYEAPKNFDWQKSYCLTEGGEIAQRSQENIELELLETAKLSALDSIRVYFNNYTHQYAGYSHQKSKSYEIQAKAAENILTAPESIDGKDAEIIEPLAQVRGISVVQMAELIQEKVKRAKEAIIKCEELEDLAKKEIKEAKNERELRVLLDDFKQRMQRELKRGKR